MGEKKYFSEVAANITETPTTYNITESNVIIERKKTYSRLYIIEKEKLKIEIDEERGKIWFVGNCNIKLIDCNRQVVYEENFQNQTKELNVNNETFKKLIQYLDNNK